jgi:hypothetical protein
MKALFISFLIFSLSIAIRAIDYNKISYIYTIEQGSFNIEGSTDCMLTKSTSFSDIVKDNKGLRCTKSHKSVNCVFQNSVICTDVARVCKGRLLLWYNRFARDRDVG